jgi:phosphoglycerol transferase MdoB-like AlkP superfamily enzyme
MNLVINFKWTQFKLYLNDLIIIFVLITFNLLFIDNLVISLITIAILISIIKIINNAKYKALSEALVFSDFALFSQVFFYPRLYLPFLNLKAVIILLPMIFFIIYWLTSLASPLKLPINEYFLYIFLTTCTLYEIFYLKKIKFIDNIENSINKYGLLTHLFKGLEISIKLANDKNFITILNQKSYLYKIQKKLTQKPIIIAIQSESFFNPEKMGIFFNEKILENFKFINKQALQFGELQVPAWGANTMRSEFAFLSAIPNQLLGAIRYYPYLFLNRPSLITLPNYLKKQNYYCVCIHPYPAGFFRRDKVFKHFGFDLFLDIEQFPLAEKVGAYISDQAVALKIIECIKQFSQKPLFIFAITMENHGPLHLESVSKSEVNSFLKINNLRKPHDLITYLRHLENADYMLKIIIQYLAKQSIPSTLCFYGDHVPSMPDVYQELNYKNPNTNYFIWHSHKKAYQENNQKNIDVSELAKYLLESL